MNTILASEKAFLLAKKIEDDGLINIADEIRMAILSGATGLEIAFRLKDKLSTLRKEQKIPSKFLLELENIQKLLN